MFHRKSRLIPISLLLLLSVLVPGTLLGEEEPFSGLWLWSPGGDLDDELFFYHNVLRYRARAVLRSEGILPEPFRAAEDSLGLISERLDDFILLQDSLALGWLPPSILPRKGRDYVDRQTSVDLTSNLVTERADYNGTSVHPTAHLGIDEYLDRMTRRTYRRLWVSESDRLIQTIETNGQRGRGLLPQLALPVEMPGAIRSIVGSGKPNLQVNGSERISFSGTSRWYPDRPVTEFQRKQSKFPQLDMKQELNLKLTGNIGDKVSVDVDQASQAATPLANRIQIHYQGYEDEIIQRVELGNTSLSLPGTQYVSYSGRHEGLFGINAEALIGDIEMKAILSKQEGKNETRSITKGAELQDKTIPDWQYVSGKFFFLTDPDGPPLSDLDLSSVEVWVDDRDGRNNNDQLTLPGYVSMDGTADQSLYSGPHASGDFNKLTTPEDYIVQDDIYIGYPVLVLSDRQTLDGRMTKALGVRYQTFSGEKIGGFLGTDPDSIVLKLIRPASEMGGTNALDLTQGDFAETRRLELRNIYDLGSNIAQEGLVVKIRRKGTSGGSTNSERNGDHTYLEILGLDLWTSASEGETEVLGPDTRIDSGRINYETGYVIFCDLQPFAPTSRDTSWCLGDGRPQGIFTKEYQVPALYLRNDWSSGTDPSQISQYEFVVTARSVASTISLGFNLLQGSETVTSGGRTLVRDRDYSIDYDTGEIVILDAADVSDTDEIKVSYSYLPFGGGGQKTLMGSALRYQPPQSKVGVSTTWVYESKGSPGIEGRRPRLGQEPTRTVVGEFAGSYKSDSWLLTELVDALPGISTRQNSNLSLDAGLGMSFPNPNTRGKLYIDDFEGAKDEFMVSMNRIGWRPSGIPDPVGTDPIGPQIDQRGECWWYSPRSAVKEGDLQPTAESSGGLADTEKDNNRQILELHFFPNGADEEEKRGSWFSLVQPLSSRGTDLSRAQFLDIWVNDYIPLDRLAEREGTINLEIGVVSEDAVWKRIRPEDLGPDSFEAPDFMLNSEDENKDGQLDDPGGGGGEDTGIDGLSDLLEEGTGEDPAYDNWEFVEGDEDADRLEPTADAERSSRYARINGTEGNGKLDTEDLNGNLVFDRSEAYFHFSIDLSDTSQVEFESSQAPDQDSKYVPYTRGWRRYRVPLSLGEPAGDGIPSWDQVRHLRVWLQGFSKETYLQIGGIEITGNRWYRGAIFDTLGVKIPEEELGVDEDFFPAVLNNKDNSTAEYTPPFKPRERQDVEEREQSLTLEMRDFAPGHVGTVFRTYSQAQDFANLYRTLEFFLNQRIREGPTPQLEFFVRFARDAVTDQDNYYEYRVPVGEGWELKEIDLGELARLQQDESCGSDTCLVVVPYPDGSRISRVGNPNLTSIARITFGVINQGPEPVIEGNVWVDELRLTGVRRDTGVAGRFAFGMTLADLAAVNVNFQRTDANFLRIGSDRGSGKTQTAVSLNGRLNLDKFFQTLGVAVPLSYSMSSTKAVPKFQPSSDLELKEVKKEDITETSQQDMSFGVSRSRSANPLLRYSIDSISLSGRMGKSESNTPLSRLSTTTRSGGIQYNVPIGGGPPLRIYQKTELRLLPTSFTVGVNGSYQKRDQFERYNGDLNREFVPIPQAATRSGSMNWSTGLRPIDPVSYSFDQTRDLRLGTAAKKLLGVNIGTETMRRHKLTASHQITLLPQSLNIAPKASWSSSFDGNFNQIQTGNALNRMRRNRLSNSSTVSFSAGLPVQRLLRLLNPFDGEETQDEPGDSTETAPRRRPARRGRGGSGRGAFSIGAVTATYTIGKSNRIERVTGEPSLGYQLGWARDPGPDVKKVEGSRASSGDRADLNLSTDVKILQDISIRTTYMKGIDKNSVNGGVTENHTRRFPDLSINWGALHKKLGLDAVVRELRANSGYTRTVTDQISGAGGSSGRTDVKISLNPLLNLDAKFKNGVSTKITSRYDSSRSEQQTDNYSNVTETVRKQVSLTLSKSINLNRMVTNPITKKKSRVTSKLDLSLSTNFGTDKRETSQAGKKVIGSDRVRFDLSTTAGYNFTSNITGNAALSFSQDTDRKSRTNTVRSVGVTVSAAFRF